jgi:hypothetical protein
MKEHTIASVLDVGVLVNHRQDGLKFDKHFDELHRVLSLCMENKKPIKVLLNTVVPVLVSIVEFSLT